MTNQYTYRAPCTEEELFEMYVNKNMTQDEIAEKLGTTQKVIWRALKKMGISSRVAKKRDQRGKKNSSWRGGRVLAANKAKGTRFSDGGYWYIRIPNHPHANKGGYVAEHVVVACRKYGRELQNGECVHHLDMDKHNNSAENLIICDRKMHRNYHLQLELIAIRLFRDGMVIFDEKANEYRMGG